MLLRLVFILSVLFPSFAFAHVDDEPRGLSCAERLRNLVTGKKVEAPKTFPVKSVSRPYNAQTFKVLIDGPNGNDGYGLQAAALIIFSQFLRDGIWILESQTGKEEQISVRSIADNRIYMPPQYWNVGFKTQSESTGADFYKLAGVTSYVEMLNIYDISDTGFTVMNDHPYLGDGKSVLKFIFDKEGYLDSLEFVVVLGSGANERNMRMVYKVKGYLEYPNVPIRPTFDIRRTE